MKARGFTLIEVLVALAIVAVALGAGAARRRRADRQRAAAGRRDRRAVVRRQPAHRAALARVLPGIGDADFSCEQLGRSYAGKLVTRPRPTRTSAASTP
jgi:general secretion pathway protein I